MGNGINTGYNQLKGEEEGPIGTIYEDLIHAFRGDSEDPNLTIKSLISALGYELIENMHAKPLNTEMLGFEPWLSPTIVGVCQELYLLQMKHDGYALQGLCMALADILELLVKAKYYPNVPQRKYHLPEFDIHALSKREIAKLKDTSMYILNHTIYELDELCGMDTAKEKGNCFIHISEFAHYGLTCALRISKVSEINETVNEMKDATNASKDKPVITAHCEGEEEDDDYDFEDAHEQMEMYERLHALREDCNDMEDWLMYNKLSRSRNFTKEDFERYRQQAIEKAQKYLGKSKEGNHKELEKRVNHLRKYMQNAFKKWKE